MDLSPFEFSKPTRLLLNMLQPELFCSMRLEPLAHSKKG